MGLSKTAKYYRDNPDARKRHVEYQQSYNKRPDQVKKRVECNKWNRKNGKKGDNIDCSHQRNNTIIGEHRSTNRARGGRDRR